MEKKRRRRTKNFSLFEEHLLINLIIPNKSILESKKTDGASNAKKEQCWVRFAEIFQRLGYPRHACHLKFKWDNLKTIARKKASIIQEEAKKRGTSDESSLNEIDRRVLEKIISKEGEVLKGVYADIVALANVCEPFPEGTEDIPSILGHIPLITCGSTCDSFGGLVLPSETLIAEGPRFAARASTNSQPEREIHSSRSKESGFQCFPLRTQSPLRTQKRENFAGRSSFLTLVKLETVATKIDCDMKEIEDTMKERVVERAKEKHLIELKIFQAEEESKLASERRLNEKLALQAWFSQKCSDKTINLQLKHNDIIL